MLTFNVHDAEAHLPCLLQAVEAGNEVMIARAGQAVARLVMLAAKSAPSNCCTLTHSIAR